MTTATLVFVSETVTARPAVNHVCPNCHRSWHTTSAREDILCPTCRQTHYATRWCPDCESWTKQFKLGRENGRSIWQCTECGGDPAEMHEMTAPIAAR